MDISRGNATQFDVRSREMWTIVIRKFRGSTANFLSEWRSSGADMKKPRMGHTNVFPIRGFD